MRTASLLVYLAVFSVLVACSGGSGGDDTSTLPDVPDTVSPDTGPSDVEDVPPTDTLSDADAPVEPDNVEPDATPDDGLPPYEEPVRHVIFDRMATPVASPYPSDWYLDPGDSHIRLDANHYSNILLPLVGDGPPIPDQISNSRGFSTYAPIVFLVSAPLDPQSLPSSGAESIDDDSPIRLLSLDDAGAPDKPVPFRVAYRSYDEWDGMWYVVTVTPLEPLADGTRHVLAVYDSLMAQDGLPFGMSLGFAQMMGIARRPQGDGDRLALLDAEASRLRHLVDLLPDSDDVIAAVDFSTGNSGDELVDLMDFVASPQAPQITYTDDIDQDGNPDIYLDGQLPGCSMSADEMGFAMAGRFTPPYFAGLDGRFVKDGDVWTLFPSPNVRFFLMVPKGEGPFPVVIVQHGIDALLTQMCETARRGVRAGVAVLRFEWPRHGDRGSGGYDFLALGDLLRIRDNFRQATLEVLAAEKLIDLLARDINPGEGETGPAIDPTRIGYLGHSLGSIIGLASLPFSKRIKVFVANVGGLGLSHLVELYLTTQMPPMYGTLGFLHLGPHAIWGADGITFARHILKDPYSEAHGGKCLLAQEVIDDDTVSNVSTEVMARTIGLPLVGTVHVPIDGVQTAEASEVQSGLVQYNDTIHGAFTSLGSRPAGVIMQDQAWHFMKTGLTGDRCEILLFDDAD